MKVLIACLLPIACIIADRLSKTWALTHLQAGAYRPFLPGLIRLALVTNTGGAFSFARGNNQLLGLIAGAIVVGLIIWLVARERSSQQLNLIELCGAGFLIGGAIGNLWDRVMLNHVVDFLDFVFINFPVFNLSDVFVNIGVGLIIIGSLSRRK